MKNGKTAYTLNNHQSNPRNNRTIVRDAAVGFFVGLGFVVVGWLVDPQVIFTPASIGGAYRTQPLHWVLALVPLGMASWSVFIRMREGETSQEVVFSTPLTTQPMLPPEPLTQPIPKRAPGPPINIEEAMPRFGNDEDFFIELLDEFVVDMQRLIRDMYLGVEESDRGLLNRGAHTLKGLGANFSAAELTRLTTKLELLSRDEIPRESRVLLQHIEFECKRILDFRQTVQEKLS